MQPDLDNNRIRVILSSMIELNYCGLIIGGFTFVTIGLGFLWVIKLEYFIGAHIAKPVGIIGFLVVTGSLFLSNFWVSALVGILGGTIIWGATELPDQQKRVEDGIFKANPNKPHFNKHGKSKSQ